MPATFQVAGRLGLFLESEHRNYLHVEEKAVESLNEFGQPTRERGILVVGHGTRALKGMAACAETVQQIRAAVPHRLLELSFLEFARPTIAEGIDELAAKGVRSIVLVPLMLLTGRHVRHDIPDAVATAVRGHRDLNIVQTEHLGCSPKMVELSHKRFLQSLHGRPAVAASQTVLVLVGRGSREDETVTELQQFAEIRRHLGDVDRIEVCFAAMATPRLEDVLSRVAEDSTRRIVIQPHLLFPGYLSARMANTVANHARNNASVDWVITDPLGPDRLLTESVVDTIQRVAASESRTP